MKLDYPAEYFDDLNQAVARFNRKYKKELVLSQAEVDGKDVLVLENAEQLHPNELFNLGYNLGSKIYDLAR